MALRQLQDEVSGMADEPPAGLEQPLLQARQRPALDGARQDQPTQVVAEVIGDDAEQEADLVGPEAVARETGFLGSRVAVLAVVPWLCTSCEQFGRIIPAPIVPK